MSAILEPDAYQGEGYNWQHIGSVGRRVLWKLAGPNTPENTDTDELDRDAMRDVEGSDHEESEA